jgi:hypothetical protein
VRAAAGLIGFDVAELDLEIFATLAEHLPHSGRSYSLEIGEHFVREHDGWMVARSHSTSVTICERRVEFAYELGVGVHE